jgi:enamine deaminase RidA (YjgF/YER057c/UK114 family)
MKKKRIISEHVEEPPPNTFSLCQVVGSQVFMSGMCSPGNDAYEQSQQILRNIRHLMEAAGGSMSDIVKVAVYLVDINDRPHVQKARSEFFHGDFPVSTMVEVSKLVHPIFKVEIEATAILGCGNG